MLVVSPVPTLRAPNHARARHASCPFRGPLEQTPPGPGKATLRTPPHAARIRRSRHAGRRWREMLGREMDGSPTAAAGPAARVRRASALPCCASSCPTPRGARRRREIRMEMEEGRGSDPARPRLRPATRCGSTDMSKHDVELGELRVGVSCALLLGRDGYSLDRAESTRGCPPRSGQRRQRCARLASFFAAPATNRSCAPTSVAAGRPASAIRTTSTMPLAPDGR